MSLSSGLGGGGSSFSIGVEQPWPAFDLGCGRAGRSRANLPLWAALFILLWVPPITLSKSSFLFAPAPAFAVAGFFFAPAPAFAVDPLNGELGLLPCLRQYASYFLLQHCKQPLASYLHLEQPAQEMEEMWKERQSQYR